jgi:hypothetical protein
MQEKNKINIYYHAVYKRQSKTRVLLLGLAFALSSWPRLVLEVFLRRSMGERYFNFSTAIFVGIVLALIPFGFGIGYGHTYGDVITRHLSWYLYLAAYLVFSYLRWKEIKREPSVFNFGKFSLSTGYWLPFFNQIVLFGKKSTPRTIATIYEPAIFTLAGILLFFMGQLVGVLFVICGVIYSMSYVAAYAMGDEFIMDQIDEMICNEQLYDSFVLQRMPEDTKGFNFFGRGPDDERQREDLANSFFTDDEEPSAMAS